MSRRFNRKNAVLSALLLGCAMVLSLAVAPRAALAKTVSDPTVSSLSVLKDKSTLELYKGGSETSAAFGYRTFSYASGKLKNVKPTFNKKFFADQWPGTKKKDYLGIGGGGLGKSKLTFTYGGKKRTVNISVKKYTNPAKKLTIGGKNLTSKFKKSRHVYKKTSKKYALSKQRIDVTPKKGWKVKGIYVYARYDESKGVMYKVIKNHTKLPSKCDSVMVVFERTSNNGQIALSYATSNV